MKDSNREVAPVTELEAAQKEIAALKAELAKERENTRALLLVLR